MKFTRDKDPKPAAKPVKPVHKPTPQPRSSQMLRKPVPQPTTTKPPAKPVARAATPTPKPPRPQPKAPPKPPPAPRQKVTTIAPRSAPARNPALDTPLGKAMAAAVKGFNPDTKDYVAVRHAGVAAKLTDGYTRVGEVKDSTSRQDGTLVVMEKTR